MALIAHWKLDDNAADTDVLDSSGNGLDGALAGGDNTSVKSVRGRVGRAFLLNGTDDYIEVADDPLLNFGAASDFTVMVWVKFTATDRLDIIGKDREEDNHWELYIRAADQTVTVYMDDNANPADSEAGTAVINDGQWHHVACSFDRDGDAVIYVDGIVDNTVDISNVGDIDNTGAQFIGSAYAGGDWYNGTLDDVRIYDEALSAGAIKKIIASGGYRARYMAGVVGNIIQWFRTRY